MAAELRRWGQELMGFIKRKGKPARIESDSNLANGVKLEELEEHLHMPRERLVRIMSDYVKDKEYSWLKGKVGAGRSLFEQHRGQILAEGQFQNAMAEYARVPHDSAPYTDPEAVSSGRGMGQEVQLDRSAAKQGLQDLGYDLAETVGRGKVDKISLSFYWFCWPETSGKVIKQMSEEQLLVGGQLHEYSVNPQLVEFSEKRK